MAISRIDRTLLRNPAEEFADPELLPPGCVQQEEVQAVMAKAKSKAAAASALMATTPGASLDSYKRVASTIAWAPSRNLLMYAFIMWMTGSQLTIYSIFFLQPLLMGPITQLTSMNQQFQAVEDIGLALTPYKSIYLTFVVLGFAMVMFKLYQLGLLPVTSADWVSLIPVQQMAERAWSASAGVA